MLGRDSTAIDVFGATGRIRRDSIAKVATVWKRTEKDVMGRGGTS